ncbi:MAG: hypothetical protein MZV64_35145 [Ignavibacteriales bacterium]|nr:hypothetical protein [Ignavibacteriales bacterium]
MLGRVSSRWMRRTVCDLQVIVSIRNGDFGNDAVGGEPPFDLLLWRNRNRDIAFDNGLAGERIALLDVVRREPQACFCAGRSLASPAPRNDRSVPARRTADRCQCPPGARHRTAVCWWGREP